MVSEQAPDLDSAVFASHEMNRALPLYDQRFGVDIETDLQQLHTCPRTIGTSFTLESMPSETHHRNISDNISGRILRAGARAAVCSLMNASSVLLVE
jgi:hypothetical protein